jgi:hypothetical protein
MNAQALESMLVKQGVMLGGLHPDARDAVLALVWTGLPDATLSEKQINEALKRRLQGAARFLDTDHVELRRWLVDLGWLQRDGYGREYRRRAMGELHEPLRSWADRLSSVNVDTWAEQVRCQHAAQREKKRQAWQAASQPA